MGYSIAAGAHALGVDPNQPLYSLLNAMSQAAAAQGKQTSVSSSAVPTGTGLGQGMTVAQLANLTPQQQNDYVNTTDKDGGSLITPSFVQGAELMLPMIAAPLAAAAIAGEAGAGAAAGAGGAGASAGDLAAIDAAQFGTAAAPVSIGGSGLAGAAGASAAFDPTLSDIVAGGGGDVTPLADTSAGISSAPLDAVQPTTGGLFDGVDTSTLTSTGSPIDAAASDSAQFGTTAAPVSVGGSIAAPTTAATGGLAATTGGSDSAAAADSAQFGAPGAEVNIGGSGLSQAGVGGLTGAEASDSAQFGGDSATGANVGVGGAGPQSSFLSQLLSNPASAISSLLGPQPAGGYSPNIAGIASALLGYAGTSSLANSLSNVASNAQAAADPFSSQRSQYQGMLSQMMTNPNYFNNDAVLNGMNTSIVNDTSRAMAAQGYNYSTNVPNNIAQRLQQQDMPYAMQQIQTTANLAGANIQPTQVGSVALQGGTNAANVAGSQTANLNNLFNTINSGVQPTAAQNVQAGVPSNTTNPTLLQSLFS